MEGYGIVTYWKTFLQLLSLEKQFLNCILFDNVFDNIRTEAKRYLSNANRCSKKTYVFQNTTIYLYCLSFYVGIHNNLIYFEIEVTFIYLFDGLILHLLEFI